MKFSWFSSIIICLLSFTNNSWSQCVTGSASAPALYNATTNQYEAACDDGTITLSATSSYTASTNIIWTNGAVGTTTYTPDCNSLGVINLTPCIPSGTLIPEECFTIPATTLTIAPSTEESIDFSVSGMCWQTGTTYTGSLPISITGSGTVDLSVTTPDGNTTSLDDTDIALINSLSPVDIALLALDTDPNGDWSIAIHNNTGSTITASLTTSTDLCISAYTTVGLICGDPVALNIFGSCPTFISASSSTGSACSGESFTLEAVIDSPAAPNVTYLWSGPGITTANQGLASPGINGQTNTTCDPTTLSYTLTMTCTNDGSIIANNISVDVSLYPEVDETLITIDNTTNVVDPGCNISVSYSGCSNLTINGTVGSVTESYTSGDNGTTASFIVSSGGSCSIEVNPPITCLSSCCLASAIATNTCITNGTFTISVDIGSMGDSDALYITPTSGAVQVVSAPTLGLSFGPYTNGTIVNIKIIDPTDPGCNQNLGNFGADCIQCPSLSSVIASSTSVCDDNALSLTALVDQGVINQDFTIQWLSNGAPIANANSLTHSYVHSYADNCAAEPIIFSAEITCLNNGVSNVPTLSSSIVNFYPIPELGVDISVANCSATLDDHCGGLVISNGGASDPNPGETVSFTYTAQIAGAPAGCQALGTASVSCPVCSEDPGDGVTTAVEVCWGDNFSINNANAFTIGLGYEVGLAISTSPITAISSNADLLSQADIGILGPYASPGAINPAEAFINDGTNPLIPIPTETCGENYYFTPFVSFSDVSAASYTYPNSGYVEVDALDVDIFSPSNSTPGLHAATISINGLPYCEGLTQYDIELCVVDEDCDGCNLFANSVTILGITLADLPPEVGISSPFPNIAFQNGSGPGQDDGMGGVCIWDPSPCQPNDDGNYFQDNFTGDPNQAITILAVNACFVGGFIPIGIDSGLSYEASASLQNPNDFPFPTVCSTCNTIGQSVAVKVMPNIEITSSLPSNGGNACPNEGFDLTTFALSATLNGAANAAGEFIWTYGSGGSDVGNPTNAIISNDQDFCVTYKLCADAMCSSNEVCTTISLENTPTLTPPIPPTVCPGESISLSGLESSITSSPGSWNWYIGDPNNGGAIIDNPGSITPLGSEQYCGEFTDVATGCRDYVCFNVQYNSNPILFAAAPILCDGDILNLTDYQSDLNPNPGSFLYYSGNPFGIPAGQVVGNPTNVADYYNGQEFYVTYNDSGTGCSVTGPFSITVNPIPVLNELYIEPVCPGGSISLTAINVTLANGVAGTFEWYLGANGSGTLLDGSNAQLDPSNQTILNTTSYTVVFTETATGCSNTATGLAGNYEIPTMVTPSFDDYCANPGPFDLTSLQTGINPNSGTWTWYSGTDDSGQILDGTPGNNPSSQIIDNGTTQDFYVDFSISAGGCTNNTTFSITVYDELTGGATFYNCTFDVLAIEITSVTGGDGGPYEISPLSPNNLGDELAEGEEYYVLVEDGSGCSLTLTGEKDCLDCDAVPGTTEAPEITFVCPDFPELDATDVFPPDDATFISATDEVYIFIVTDPNSDDIDDQIIDFSEDGLFDFSDYNIGTELCFTGLYYDADELEDLLTDAVNNATFGPILSANGVSNDATLVALFLALDPLFGPFDVEGVFNLLTNTDDPLTLPSLLDVDPPCMSVSDSSFCVTYTSCEGGCIPPMVEFIAYCDEQDEENYYISVFVDGGSGSYSIGNSLNDDVIDPALEENIVGPIVNDEEIIIMVTDIDNDECAVTSFPLSLTCDPNACQANAGNIVESSIFCTADLLNGLPDWDIPSNSSFANAGSVDYLWILTEISNGDIKQIVAQTSALDLSDFIFGESICITGFMYDGVELVSILELILADPTGAILNTLFGVTSATTIPELYDIVTDEVNAPLLGSFGISITDVPSLITLFEVTLPGAFPINVPCLDTTDEFCMIVDDCVIELPYVFVYNEDIDDVMSNAPGIADPCICLSNASEAGNGQFSEVVRIISLPNETWTITAIEGAYDLASEDPPNDAISIEVGEIFTAVQDSVYEFAFIHVDGEGYSITISNGTDALSITNTCIYPDPIFANIEETICQNLKPFNIIVNIDNAIGSGSFYVDDEEIMEFDPSDYDEGIYILKFNFVQEDIINDINYGCELVKEQEFEIVLCNDDPCETFEVITSVDCDEIDEEGGMLLYHLYVTALNESYNEAMFLIESNNDDSISEEFEGSFIYTDEHLNGYSFTISMIDFPACSTIIEQSFIDCIPTAIDLEYFTAEEMEVVNKIEWAATVDESFQKFELYRSSNGIESWKKIYTCGASDNNKYFRYDDYEVTFGTYYYKLSALDFNNDKDFESHIVNVVRKNFALPITVKPVPTNDFLYIQLNEKNHYKKLNIYNIEGRLVATRVIASFEEEISLDVRNYKTGTYFLEIIAENDMVHTKFVKYK